MVLGAATMTRRAALCAMGFFLVGCALAHERSVDAPDAFFSEPDAFVLEVDSGMPTSCAEHWTRLPWCPADPASLLGQHCETEGLACGTQCCELAPAIVCSGGVWARATEPDCAGVRCGPNVPCGTGACASDRICLHTSSEVHLPERCVVPPFAPDSCDGAPPGWLVDDPRACMQCTCRHVARAEIWLECACCD